MPVYSSREKIHPGRAYLRLLIFEEISNLDVYSIVDVYFIKDIFHTLQLKDFTVDPLYTHFQYCVLYNIIAYKLIIDFKKNIRLFLSSI